MGGMKFTGNGRQQQKDYYYTMNRKYLSRSEIENSQSVLQTILQNFEKRTAEEEEEKEKEDGGVGSDEIDGRDTATEKKHKMYRTKPSMKYKYLSPEETKNSSNVLHVIKRNFSTN